MYVRRNIYVIWLHWVQVKINDHLTWHKSVGRFPDFFWWHFLSQSILWDIQEWWNRYWIFHLIITSANRQFLHCEHKVKVICYFRNRLKVSIQMCSCIHKKHRRNEEGDQGGPWAPPIRSKIGKIRSKMGAISFKMGPF